MASVPSRRLRSFSLAFADALVYALVVTLLTFLAGVLAGVILGGGLLHTKYFLFLAGFVLMAVGTAGMWPSQRDNPRNTVAGVPVLHRTKSISNAIDRSRFQQIIDGSLPVRLLTLPPPNRRWSTAAKLFLASLLVLLSSFLMEAVFGIAA